MTNQTRLQYYCSNCKNILRETESDMGISVVVEPCPFCGSLLSESLQKRSLIPRTEKAALFQAASKVPRLAVDIKKMDSILPFLSLGQKVLLVGHFSQKLIERFAVRAQLPYRYGGLGSNVVIVDGGNSSDPYLGISLARQYGLDVNRVLSRIISSRAFTVHQLENLITKDLPDAIKRYDAKLVMISDMLAMFGGDPFLDDVDARNLLQSISESISRLEDCIVIASISKPTIYDDIITRSFGRIIRLQQRDGSITIDADYKACVIKECDLEVIPRR